MTGCPSASFSTQRLRPRDRGASHWLLPLLVLLYVTTPKCPLLRVSQPPGQEASQLSQWTPPPSKWAEPGVQSFSVQECYASHHGQASDPGHTALRQAPATVIGPSHLSVQC